MKQWRSNGYTLRGPVVVGGFTPPELTFHICPSTLTAPDYFTLVNSLMPASSCKNLCLCEFDCSEENPLSRTLNGYTTLIARYDLVIPEVNRFLAKLSKQDSRGTPA